MSFSIDVTEENFITEVIEASHKTPVLVDFWATWCGPCQTLMPVLTKLAEEYSGKFRLVKVEIDQQQNLATQFAVRSVPTVKLVINGEIDMDFALERMKYETHKFARRQYTWFRKDDSRIHWFDVYVNIKGKMYDLVQRFIDTQKGK